MNSGKTTPRRDALFAFVVIGAVFATLTAKTWRKWPDLVVDFGAQLYTPWQLSLGAVLYRDVHYLPGGPLSQYYHALLFKIFGASFLTLVISNLAVVVLLVAVIYFSFYRCADQLMAITACVAVLVVFAFAQYTTLGIFNYITPYSAEVVHGLVLSIVAVALLARWFATQNRWLAGAVGFCGGLTLLTKPDMFLALAVTVASGAALFWEARRQGKSLCRALAFMSGAGLIPVVGFFLWFFRVENGAQSLRSVFAAWIPLLTTRAASNSFYRWCLGLDKPWVHLLQTFHQFVALAGIIAMCALLAWRKIPEQMARLLRQPACLRNLSNKFPNAPALLAWLAPIPLAYELINVSWDFNWFNCGQCLPLLCLTLLAALVCRGAATGWTPTVVFPALWTIWSMALLAKLGFFCRIWHYGFALAMPASVSALYLLLWELPQQLERIDVKPAVLRGLLWLFLLPGLTRLTQSSLNLYSEKTMPIGAGADMIVAYSSHFRALDTDMAEALRWVEKNVPPRATLTVLPQGVMLNFLSRHTNPCGYAAWNPPEMAAFGQDAMTRAFIAHSPDIVIELFVNYGEYDEPLFGLQKRFGLDAQQWIDAHYKLVKLIDHDWLQDNKFGIKILRKSQN